MVSIEVLSKEDETPSTDEPDGDEPGIADHATGAALPSPGHMDDLEVPVRPTSVRNRSHGLQVGTGLL